MLTEMEKLVVLCQQLQMGAKTPAQGKTATFQKVGVLQERPAGFGDSLRVKYRRAAGEDTGDPICPLSTTQHPGALITQPQMNQSARGILSIRHPADR